MKFNREKIRENITENKKKNRERERRYEIKSRWDEKITSCIRDVCHLVTNFVD
jgi:hypothetical protein